MKEYEKMKNHDYLLDLSFFFFQIYVNLYI